MQGVRPDPELPLLTSGFSCDDSLLHHHWRHPLIHCSHRFPLLSPASFSVNIKRKSKRFVSLPAATKLGQGNVFTGVCDSVHGGGGCVSQHALHQVSKGGGYVSQYALQVVSQHALQQVYRGVCIPACLAAGLQGGGVSRPTPKGEIEGDQIQAHTQGGN